MLYRKLDKNTLQLKRSKLISSTSTEIVKQKKLGAAARVTGNKFARHFAPNKINEALTDETSFLVAVKYVDVGGTGLSLLTSLVKSLKCSYSILPISGIRSLYSILLATNNLSWLVPILSSPSTYILIVDSGDDFATLVSQCITAEKAGADQFFEVLFIKEGPRFVDFRRSTENAVAASSLRDLYSHQGSKNIWLELYSCISSVQFPLMDTLSTSLSGVGAALYPQLPSANTSEKK